MTFSQDMALPPDGSGMSITDDAGNTLSIVTVSQPGSLRELAYDGVWSPADPIPGVDTITINYTASSGDLQSLLGLDVADFSGVPTACGLATNLVATTFDDDRIDLTWTESLLDPSVTYELFRNAVSIQTFVYGDDAYSDTGLDPDTLYSYRLDTLFGVNPIGSITDSATTDPAPAFTGVPVSASLSASASFIHSFDLQQTLNAPLNTALPQFNTARF